MQGSRNPFFVVAVGMLGIGLGGCTVNNYPAPESQQPQQQQQRQQSQQRQAPAVATAKPVPAPATRSAAAPAPVTPQAKPAPEPAATGRTYTIKPGDNLWNIAKEVYGDATKYQRIIDANPGINPDNMKPGTKIAIP